MKKLFTILMFTMVGGTVFSQWTPAKVRPEKNKRSEIFSATNVRMHYKLDIDALKSQLKETQEMGSHSQPVVISVPTMNGQIEKFNVYSFPVVVKSLAEKYQLGSYVGAGVDDPTKTIRFSVSPKGFHSMLMKAGKYEFIDPEVGEGDVILYGVHPKKLKGGNKIFQCTTNESPAAVSDIAKLYEKGNSFTNQRNDFSRVSDRKFRTMRLVLSVTGEYTQYHGGTVQGAVEAINTTMTRVNGVFERDFALHLNVQDQTGVIYTDPSTDPYSPAAYKENWSEELQTTLTNVVGNANYDIGHLFGASGGGGNAGCIGCVCVNPTTAEPNGKGSGYTSPANSQPEGDNFDIDYVAHEMGHQLGANHTFSDSLEPYGTNQEPGSGSTIMGYAGITGPNTDVQRHTDAYFHKASIGQVQGVLIQRTCDVETSITNTPPVIANLPTYNIPKGTAFILTASAADAENDPLTYTWEEIDNAQVTINKDNLGTTSTGASFRSMYPSTSPTRYFPSFTSVMDGVLNNANNTWESVSSVPRTTKFAVTVRDNNPNVQQQQTAFKVQQLIVGNDGPFKVLNQYVDINAPSPVQWAVANTNASPYNVANVKIDYTINNGTSWTVLSDSTPNDGSETFTFPSSLNGQTIKIRVSAIGNVFYAVGAASLVPIGACSSSAPTNLAVGNVTTSSASVSWMPSSEATYKVRYRKIGSTVWSEEDSSASSIDLNGLLDDTNYEVQVAMVCGTTVGEYSASVNFTTKIIEYCESSVYGIDPSLFEYISNITVGNINNTSTVSASGYSNYTSNPALQVNLTKGTTVPISLTITNVDYDAAAVWIDYNRDGIFTDNEMVLNSPVSTLAVRTGSFSVPSSAVEGRRLRMRAVLYYAGQAYSGASLSSAAACGEIDFGEIEDYNVMISPSSLSTNDVRGTKSGIQLYPNPVTDILNVTNVSDKTVYKIYNAAGQLILKGNVNAGQINVSSLIKGGYVISIEDKGLENFTSKFIKK